MGCCHLLLRSRKATEGGAKARGRDAIHLVSLRTVAHRPIETELDSPRAVCLSWFRECSRYCGLGSQRATGPGIGWVLVRRVEGWLDDYPFHKRKKKKSLIWTSSFHSKQVHRTAFVQNCIPCVAPGAGSVANIIGLEQPGRGAMLIK